VKQFRAWLWDAGAAWYKDNAMRMSSSLAYYTLLSLAPILLLMVSIAGLFLGGAAARTHFASLASQRFGDEAGAIIEAIVLSTSDKEESLVGTQAGLVMIVIGASGMFSELQSAMNTIWEVAPRRGRGFKGLMRDRFVCFAMVGSVAVLLVILLAVGALLAILGSRIGTLPGGIVLWRIVDFALSVVAVTVLFALSYKAVPDVIIPLSEVWPGALLTAFLFVLSELAFAAYLQYSMVPKPTGVAGSVVVLVTWVYYTGQIFFYGAEFTKVRAAARGVLIVPRRHAVRVQAPAPAVEPP
jgi:membrane protein